MLASSRNAALLKHCGQQVQPRSSGRNVWRHGSIERNNNKWGGDPDKKRAVHPKFKRAVPVVVDPYWLDPLSCQVPRVRSAVRS